jgi:hypothetical protein
VSPTAWEPRPLTPDRFEDFGTRSMFERAGFAVVGTTDATASGMRRLVIRRELTA